MDLELNKQDEAWAKAFRDRCHAEAEQPASFWTAQRANVREKIARKSRFWGLRIALASTVALVAVAIALLVSERHPIVTAPPQIAEHHAISDQQLLADIDETLADPTPDALAPMELISQDLDKSFQTRSNSKQIR
ncbi:MAG: hypothetical protein ACM3JB_25290 [Acidobacteriaceae bacterium]